MIRKRSRTERRASVVQMSGPLSANSNREVVFQPPQGAVRQNTGEPEVERYPSSINRIKNNDWAVDDYIGNYEHILRSGQLGKCNDPYCTTCPMYYNDKGRQKPSITSEISDAESHMNRPPGDAKCWAKRMWSCLRRPCILGVLNPHAKLVRQWKKFFVFSCSFTNFLDPLFCFLLYVQENNKCIAFNWPMTKAIVILRSITDFIYLLHIILQFNLAYVAPDVTGDLVDGPNVAPESTKYLVDDPKMIARNYLYGHFIIDFFVVLPLPQIVILLILPNSISASDANYAKKILPFAILVQLVPRLYRLLHLVAGSSPIGFIFESIWSYTVMTVLTFILASYLVGSFWYLFGLQRVNQCFSDACGIIIKNITRCMEYIDCGHGDDYGRRFGNDSTWEDWKKNENSIACLWKDGFDYGIYQTAVNLTTHKNIFTRYMYSLFWGLQQISTMAGNQEPGYSMEEVFFTMFILGSGILNFTLLIGNIQNILQAIERRKLEMSSRRRDVEQWMNHRRLPENLRRQVQNTERINWAVTRGVNEEILMENLPEDLQKKIRRHIFKFKKVRIFKLLDEPIIDAIRERLKMKMYIKGSKIWCREDLVDKMVYIIRGVIKVSVGEDDNVSHLSEGDVCGEELLTWCLERYYLNKDGKRVRNPEDRLLSKKVVSCLTNVEAFALRAADLEEVISLFARFFMNPRIQDAIRSEIAATRIQDAWRCKKKRINRARLLVLTA